MKQNELVLHRHLRQYYVIMSPLLLLAWIGATILVMRGTDNPLRAIPLVVVGAGMLRQVRWILIWLSTPAERKILARYIDKEPFLTSAVNCLGRLRTARKQEDP